MGLKQKVKVDETNKRALTWERHIKMKMVGIQAVYLIALNIFQYRERIRHLFITALENDTKYLRRKLSRLINVMLRLPSYVYKNTRYTITHYYFCKLLNKPFIYLHVCTLTYRRPSILKGWGWGDGYLHTCTYLKYLHSIHSNYQLVYS